MNENDPLAELELKSLTKPPAESIKMNITSEGGPLLHVLNGTSEVTVPEGMTVRHDPNGFDYIVYRGIDITLYEQEVKGPYTGKFAILTEKLDQTDLPDLEAAKKLIDEAFKPIPAVETRTIPVNEVFMTKEQVGSLYDRWKLIRETERKTFGEFLSTVQPTFGCDDAVVVKWCGMFLIIEKDGYCHS